jgi:hypothetical protein
MFFWPQSRKSPAANLDQQPICQEPFSFGEVLRQPNPPNLERARETARPTIRDSTRAADVITRLRALFSRRDFSPEPMD